MPARKKPKRAASARVVHQANGTVASQKLTDLALSCIRQWVFLDQQDVVTADDAIVRQAARDKLQRAAELLVNAEIGLFVSTEGGRKGGKRGTNTKAQAILAEADKRQNIGTAELQAIHRKTGASIRTVRDTLAKAGKYQPQKKGK